MYETHSTEETQGINWSAPVEVVAPVEPSAQPHRLVKVAVVVSVLSLLIAGYSMTQNVRNENLLIGSTGESVAVDDIDLFYPPKDLPGLIQKVEESVVAIECEANDGNWWYGTGFINLSEAETDGF
jgi:hypothetical protein